MSPKLSIQIALHNRAGFIRASLSSALNCGYGDTEIIVFNDASSDNSGDVVKSIIAEHPGKIRYIRSEENAGCANARATMVNETESEYILILDDDDILLPFDIAGQIDFLDRNPDFAVSYGKIFLTDEKLNPLHSVMGGTCSRFILSYNTPVTHPASIIRRSDIIDAGNYEVPGSSPKTVAEDLFLWFKLSQRKDCYFDNSFRLLYRQHSAQTTSRKTAYIEAANFIHKSIVDNNKNIYDRILSGKITAEPHEVKTVILLLSIISRYMQSDSPQRLQVLNAAETLAPDDYGVNAVKFEYFLEKKDYASALAEAAKILNNPNSDVYTRKLGFDKILNVYEQTGEPATEIKKQIKALEFEYVKFDFDISKFIWN